VINLQGQISNQKMTENCMLYEIYFLLFLLFYYLFILFKNLITCIRFPSKQIYIQLGRWDPPSCFEVI